MRDNCDTIKSVCEAIANSDLGSGTAIIKGRYPFVGLTASRSSFTETECMQVFIRDGFLDRYSCDRLVFPPVRVRKSVIESA